MDKVLRASKIGFPCMRNLWYSANGYEGVTSEKTQRIFDVGTYLEPLVVEWLKNDGWNVEYNPGSQVAEFEISIPLYGGALKGHPDCFISRPDGLQNVLADIKTMNDRAFTFWKRGGTLKTKPQYVEQLHVYALGAMALGRKVEHLAIVGVNKNNSDMHIDVFDFDQNTADVIRDKAEFIFGEMTPPDFYSPSENWCCDYCEYSGMCDLHKAPTVAAPATKDFAVTTDTEIINAMKSLQHARDLSKEARELEDSAKATLDANIKAKGLCSVQGGGYICSIFEKTSSRFDTTAFKKAHPDLAGAFTKTSKSTVYELKNLQEDFSNEN